MIDISGIDKAELLAALWNRARVPGIPHWVVKGMEPMTVEAAREIIGRVGHSFDYLESKPLKVNIEGSEMWEALYDRDSGDGAAAQVVAELRAKAVAR